MILKAADSFIPKDKFEASGQKAEAQLAYYLQRAFGETKVVHVINGLRFEHGGHVAQIDHLILHPFGWIVIESKSVTSEVSINEHGEWARKWEGRWQGMPSPIKQAERQLILFNQMMDTELPRLFTRRFQFLGPVKPGEFQSHVLVAVSDHGLISGKNRPAGVCKAEAIVDAVLGHIEAKRKQARSLFSLKTYMELGIKHLAELGEMLLEQHKPLAQQPQQPGTGKQRSEKTVPPPPAITAPAGGVKKCRSCQSERLQMVYGKYGYYFQCPACQGNTPVAAVFPEFKNGFKIRKQGQQFFLEHPEKGTSVLFHTNAG